MNLEGLLKEKKVDISATKEARSVSESMQGGTDSIEAESFAKKETGGSATQKSDKLVYKKSSNTISPEVIADNMNNILGDFMFEVTEYDEFSADYDAPERLTLENEFIKDNRLSRPTKKSVSDMMKMIEEEEPEFKYLLTTILDTDQAFVDSTSGNQKVVVNITARSAKVLRRGVQRQLLLLRLRHLDLGLMRSQRHLML